MTRDWNVSIIFLIMIKWKFSYDDKYISGLFVEEYLSVLSSTLIMYLIKF